MNWKVFNSTQKISVLVFLFLLVSLPLAIIATLNPTKIFKRAAESGTIIISNQSQQPQYKEGEVLVKLKNSSQESITLSDLEKQGVPTVFKTLDQKYKIAGVEKVFKTALKPAEEITKFKQKFPQRKIDEKKLSEIDLSKIYKLSFDKNADINQIVSLLTSDPEIEYAEPNYTYTIDVIPEIPKDPYYSDTYPGNVLNRDPNWNPPHDYQWNIKKTNSSGNWLVDTSPIVVAVIDTGVDITHPELGNIWINQNEIPGDGIDNDNNGCVDDINGCGFTYSGIADDNNHGTHIAGVISAKTNNQMGIAGITNNAKIMAVKAMYENGYGYEFIIAPAIKYAVDNGAKVINMSLGGSSSQVIKEALDYANSHGVIIVVSAGNGNNYSPSSFPASYKPAITVAAVDEDLNKLKYSNYGPNIDVAAPGGGKPCEYSSKPSYCSNILSLKSSQNTHDLDLVVGEKYLRLSGTSMAAPHVAGIVALLLAQNPNFTLQDVENYIRFNSIATELEGFDEYTGWGVINSNSGDFVTPTNTDFIVNNPAENALVGNIFSIDGTIKADNFLKYEVKYRLKGSNNWIAQGVVLTNSGNSQVIPDFYTGVGSIANITLPTNSQRGVYEIKTTVYFNNGKTLSSTKSVNFLQKVGTNWTPTGTGEILIDDINEDGKKEIILFGYGNFTGKFLKVFDYQYNLLWENTAWGQAVVGNLDKRSPGKEIVIGASVFDARGNNITDMNLGISIDGKSNIITSDTDNNNVDELFVSSGKTIYCLEQNSSFQFTVKWSKTFNNATYVKAIGDLNADGKKEIVVSGSELTIFDSNGVQLSQKTGGVINLILGDMDIDNKEEIIVYDGAGIEVLKLNNNIIETVWTYPKQNERPDTLMLADFNNDNYPEIFYQNAYSPSYEEIFDRNGHLILQGNRVMYSSYNLTNVALADRNNNGKTEIFYSGQRNVDDRTYLDIREYDNLGNSFAWTDGAWKPIYFNQRGAHTPIAISDLDGNGKLDLIIAGLGIIEYEGQGKVYWPFRYHDAQRTNSYNSTPQTVIPTLAPSPSPTPTSTPKPTVIPTATPKPPRPTLTPTPTPSSTPIPNRNPVIITTSLPTGRFLRPYTATIMGYDPDRNPLTIKISNLPPALRQGNCTSVDDRPNQTSFYCKITGGPLRIGTFNIKIELRDNRGGSTQKTLPLTVKF